MAGWNGGGMRGNSTPIKPKAEAKKPSPVRGLVAGAVLVAAVIGCYFAFFSGSDAPAQEAKASSSPTSIKTAKATLPSAKPNVAANVKTVEGGTSTNAIARQQTATNSLPPMTEKERATFERAKRDTTLRTLAENRMRLLASVKPGMPVPPMPGSLTDKEIEDSLHNRIEFLPDDTEKDKEYKQFVIDLKERIKSEMAQGKSASEAYNDYIKLMNSAADMKTTAYKMIREMQAQGDSAETVGEFVNAVNAKLDEIGVEPIDLNHRPKGKPKK